MCDQQVIAIMKFIFYSCNVTAKADRDKNTGQQDGQLRGRDAHAGYENRSYILVYIS